MNRNQPPDGKRVAIPGLGQDLHNPDVLRHGPPPVVARLSPEIAQIQPRPRPRERRTFEPNQNQNHENHAEVHRALFGDTLVPPQAPRPRPRRIFLSPPPPLAVQRPPVANGLKVTVNNMQVNIDGRAPEPIVMIVIPSQSLNGAAGPAARPADAGPV
ncbi:unnamed protein product [Caenorhabditis sp. 36 PRJEB53466]|nr:unnamed protein product [Caenorhabditis sp. 36 PRJEB53466]